MLEKSYSATGRACKVMFRLPAETGGTSAAVLGEFNDWDAEANPMKRKRDGSFEVSISLKPGASYRFRYLVDGERWENDPSADGYIPNEFGTEDSVINI